MHICRTLCLINKYYTRYLLHLHELQNVLRELQFVLRELQFIWRELQCFLISPMNIRTDMFFENKEILHSTHTKKYIHRLVCVCVSVPHVCVHEDVLVEFLQGVKKHLPPAAWPLRCHP